MSYYKCKLYLEHLTTFLTVTKTRSLCAQWDDNQFLRMSVKVKQECLRNLPHSSALFKEVERGLKTQKPN